MDAVTCPRHGDGYATYVCTHVAEGADRGWFTAGEGGEERPNAWCADCDAVLLREGDWNVVSEAYARVTMICSGCYDEARARNA